MMPWQDKVLTIDDVCPSNLKYWNHLLEIKKEYPDTKVTAFVIANYRNEEDVSQSQEFWKWFEMNRSWVTIGVHGYDHLEPQEGWRDDQEIWIRKALTILRPFLPPNFLYRPPGFRTLAKTEGILGGLGFAGIAYQTRIKWFDGRFEIPFNSHCLNKYFNPVTLWKNWI